MKSKGRRNAIVLYLPRNYVLLEIIELSSEKCLRTTINKIRQISGLFHLADLLYYD